jgi:hypothetical protein
MSYELLPAGEYLAVAVASEGPDGNGILHLGVTKNGYDQMIVRFSIAEGEYKGRTLTWFASLSSEQPKDSGYGKPGTPPCLFTLKGLRAMGFAGDDLNDAFTQPLDETVRLVVEVNEYEGKTTNRIRWVNPIMGRIIANAPDESRRRMLLAKMNTFLEASPAPATPRNAKNNDDIPF